jgi:hypothetical protein
MDSKESQVEAFRERDKDRQRNICQGKGARNRLGTKKESICKEKQVCQRKRLPEKEKSTSEL